MPLPGNGFSKHTENIDAERFKNLVAIDQSFVSHHRIKEHSVSGPVAWFGFDQVELLRDQAACFSEPVQSAAVVGPVKGAPWIMSIIMQRAQLVGQTKMPGMRERARGQGHIVPAIGSTKTIEPAGFQDSKDFSKVSARVGDVFENVIGDAQGKRGFCERHVVAVVDIAFGQLRIRQNFGRNVEANHSAQGRQECSRGIRRTRSDFQDWIGSVMMHPAQPVKPLRAVPKILLREIITIKESSRSHRP
jgi:hypothetical protein